jgi:acetyl-CoA carboxylase biotin carboxyl carrier protein
MADSKKPVPGKVERPVPRGGANGGNGMRIDPALVRELAGLLTDNELTEIEVQDGDRRIKVARELFGAAAVAPRSSPVVPAPAAAAAPLAAAPEAATTEEITGTTIKSPMVGTAFLSPEPGAKPFVEVGDAVKAGDTLLIVEAMKVMNPITAPRAGTVSEVLVVDAQPVEYDQPLVVLE